METKRKGKKGRALQQEMKKAIAAVLRKRRVPNPSAQAAYMVDASEMVIHDICVCYFGEDE